MGERKPNIRALVRREDIEGLERAAAYQDLRPTPQGSVSDFGTPVRAEAILALGSLDSEGDNSALARALRDAADLVRSAAVRALHTRGEAGLLVEALRWLPGDEGHSRKLALQAVFDLKEFVSAPAIADALVHREDEEVLSEDDAPLVLGLLEGAPADERYQLIKLLVTALGDERGIVADRAAELLVRLAPMSTEGVVAELREGSAAAEAAYVLGRIANPDTVDALVDALGHRNPRVRAESAAALGELQDPASVEPLLEATRDRDHGVRRQARLALDRLGNTAVIAGVAALLEPMIQEAVRAAICGLAGEERDRASPSGKPARPESRAHGSNGGSPGTANGGASNATKFGSPEAADRSSEADNQPQ
ncbi:MAG: HEAT repeat domain-containing protein [Thermoleophilaceae bacterium]|nr:HEAT repeat domain-containing protein [Thermoleophilaceae bacterium]